MNRKGQVTWLMVAVVAVAIAMIPITKWLLTMHSSADDLQTRMAMQQIITDKWNAINAEEFEALDETIAAKGTSWTEQAGEGNRWTIQTDFGNKGKYVNTVCTNATPGADDRRCRQVSIQITDAQTGKTQAVNLTKADSRYLNSRMKKTEDDLAAFRASTNSKFASVDSSMKAMEERMNELEKRGGIVDKSLGRNGYIEFDNGFMIQWGYTVSTSPSRYVNFPKQFAHACTAVALATARSASGYEGYNHAYGISRTGFTGLWDADGNTGGYWMAVGY